MLQDIKMMQKFPCQYFRLLGKLVVPNVKSGEEVSRAFEIQVERSHLPALKFLLEEIYAIVPPRS
jgi:hypothetical protein